MGFSGRLVTTTAPLMRAFVVVMPSVFLRDPANLFQGARSLSQQALAFVRTMIAFNVAVGSSRQLPRLRH